MSQSGWWCQTWRAPRTSLASRVGGCGVVGRQRLEDGEEVWRCCRFDATSVGEDLPALRTTPFQEGEDDEGIMLGMLWSVDSLGQAIKTHVICLRLC